MIKKERSSVSRKSLILFFTLSATMFIFGFFVSTIMGFNDQSYRDSQQENSITEPISDQPVKYYYNPNFECPDNFVEQKFERMQFCVPADLQKQEVDGRLLFFNATSSEKYIFSIGNQRYGLFDNGAFCRAKPEIFSAEDDYLSFAVYLSKGTHLSQYCEELVSQIVLVEDSTGDLKYFEVSIYNLPVQEKKVRTKQFVQLINSIK